MSLTRALVEGVWAIRFEDLDEADLDALRALLLDHLGVAARGAATPSGGAARAFAARLGRAARPALPLIGSRRRAGALHAALINACAAHAIEYDDVHNASSTHPGVTVFSAALAAWALAGADERAFVEGVVAGYEVLCRVGRAADPAAQYARGFHPTGTCGQLGAAAAAARILGLGVEEAVCALGAAAAEAAGSMRFLADGSWVKHLNAGQAARSGVEAALLARAGFEAGPDGIAGARGFLQTFSGRARPERLVEGLGERPLELRATSIKAHTCCRYKQGPIDALLELRRKHAVRPEQIARVEVGVLSAGMDIVAEPAAAKRRPRSLVDAQFSMPFGAAVALLEGSAGLEQYDPTRLDDPAVLALMDRVECAADPELDRLYPERWPAWARVHTTAGAVLQARVEHPRGDPENPLPPAELRAKFDALTSRVYTPKRRSAIAETVARLEQPGSLEQLVRLLPGKLS
jgi:2-methylcitrate dehydratase PrpD